MSYNPQNPIIVQGDKSILLEVDSPHYAAARDVLARFAELEKSPEYVHTYRITPLSLWNAASTGISANTILDGLEQYSKYPVPSNVSVDIKEYIGRYGRVKLVRENGQLRLISEDVAVIVDAEHLCVSSRGIEDTSSSTVTSFYSGNFDNSDTKKEFLTYVYNK